MLVSPRHTRVIHAAHCKSPAMIVAAGYHATTIGRAAAQASRNPAIAGLGGTSQPAPDTPGTPPSAIPSRDGTQNLHRVLHRRLAHLDPHGGYANAVPTR